MADRFRALWDFDDLDGTRRRFEAELTDATGPQRAEVLTQLARVRGLSDDVAGGHALLDEADALAGDVVSVHARIHLERGRLHRKADDPATAQPLFETAYRIARETGAEYLAVDAAHMVALAEPDREQRHEWTSRAIEVAAASAEAEVIGWLGPLYNNQGWDYFDAGDYTAALAAFELGLQVRERRPDQPAEREIARYTVGRALRALGRADDAIPLLEQAIEWTRSVEQPDGWFHEELAEEYAAVGRTQEAAEHARLAMTLLVDPTPEQVTRLRALVAT